MLNRTLLLRSLILAAAAIWAAVSWQPWRLGQVKASENVPAVNAAWLRSASDAATVARFLLDEYPETIDRAGKVRLNAALSEFDAANQRSGVAVRFRERLSQAELSAELTAADRARVEGARQVGAALDQLPNLVRWDEAADMERDTAVPFGGTAVVVRRHGDDLDGPPQFVTRRIDAGGSAAHDAEFPEGSFFGVIALGGIPRGTAQHSLALRSGARRLALQLHTSALPTHRMRFQVLGDDGKPTEATVAIYSEDGRFLVPESALDFSAGGFRYDPTKFRNLVNAKYWPGEEGYERAFFVRGDFEINLPAGNYRVLASKGPEYIAADQQFSVPGSSTPAHTIRLKRWADMSARGWHSGDCHIHYERLDQAADERLRLWTKAEDLRMGNILRMGDARETFFEQRAWGKAGRANWPGLSLVPGQEDPRTSVIGHTISLNLPQPVRFEQSYYLYGKVFDEVRRIGGLAGYAHVNDGNFLVDRDMAISIARGKVDFVEICEFGKIGVDLYYEFLNLGFRLTAAGGSDVPWGARGGATVGDSRVYVHTGGPFDPDRWFDAFKQGRTFVTVGPMLDFTVDGELPGAKLKREKGDRLKIRATASIGDPRIPFEKLEIVANGEVIHSAPQKAKQSVIEFDLPLEHGLWIAARTVSSGLVGAHTTPIYVSVGGDRHGNPAELGTLVRKQLASLNEVEQLVKAAGEGIGDGRQGNWENVSAFRQGAAELQSAINEAGRVYQELEGTAP